MPQQEEVSASGRRFDAVLIDFYGTVCSGDREAVEAACSGIVDTLGLPVSPQEFAIRWGERFFDALSCSNHGSFQTLYQCEIASLRAILLEFGETADPAPFVGELEGYWANPPIYADAVEFLERLSLPICCVSNADTVPLMAAIDRLNVRFDAVVTSESVRCYKPDPKIFRAALEALGVRAQRAIHVGDSLHSDIAGAGPLGLTTAWVCRKNRIHDIGDYQPDYTINVLTELHACIGG